MELTLPVYVEARRTSGQTMHYCRPLFFSGPVGADARLGLAISKLGTRLKKWLDEMGSRQRHETLAACAFAPQMDSHLLKLSIDLRARTVRCKLLFVTFAALQRTMAFTPAFPDLWFTIDAGQSLQQRAAEVLTDHFRRLEKSNRRSGDDDVSPESASLEGQAWISTLDLRIRTRPASDKTLQRMLAALFDENRLDGDHELQRVGRCLDWLYPDELLAATAREREVTELDQLLDQADNRPLVLVGQRRAGKTAVLHECVRRRVVRRGKPYATKRNVWLLSPQRLIAGMMYVGQWESRVQAIFLAARKRQHVLYFDDFLGLYQAGVSRDAKLSVADVLKPFVLRRELRVLAEMTPEAWQALQERDRGLADQFHVLRIDEMNEADTRRVMLASLRQLEVRHRCRFDLDVLPRILQLQHSYIRDAVFPGKAAAFASRLAEQHAGAAISRQDVVAEFHRQTSLSLELLDDRRTLDRQTVVDNLRAKVIGQHEAVQAAADVVTIAKALLAATDRPLATLLFLGPTGVGKTQCAKALAEVMFSEAGRLLRFDMNEYGSGHAVAQLVGTFDQPDGLLTSAVRQQPFSVVLLDEIEKAHPDVFDLLLQVTGEGRLTDALGRTADFSNAVIVMTSNLGTTAGAGPIGLTLESAARRDAFAKAAERFFRPEFFNRIDRVIPFGSLARDEMRQIASLLLKDIFSRDGLVSRRCALSVEPAALETIVDAGYHPQFGARALKRAVEQRLVHPVAVSLAGVKPELPTLIAVLPHPQGVVASVHPLDSVEPVLAGDLSAQEPAAQLDAARRFLARTNAEIEDLRPPGGISSQSILPEQEWFYALKEQWQRVQETVKALSEVVFNLRPAPNFSRDVHKSGGRRKQSIRNNNNDDRRVRDMMANEDIHAYLHDLAKDVPRPEALQARFSGLRCQAALLQTMQSSRNDPDQVVVAIRALSEPAIEPALRLAGNFQASMQRMTYDCRRASSASPAPLEVLRLAGPGIWPLAMAEAGVHVYCQRHENLLPIQVSVFPAGAEAAAESSPAGALTAYLQRRQRWLGDLASGRAAAADDPYPLGRIVRFYDEGGPTLDLRSGLSIPRFPTASDWETLLLAGLRVPPEWEE